MPPKKSSKQRRIELDAKRQLRADREAAQQRDAQYKSQLHLHPTAVDLAKLARDNSYSTPDFAKRGYYVDLPFVCIDCGKSEVWSATQQKWWYEVAKGGVWTTATRCRPCRQAERKRREKAKNSQSLGASEKTKRNRRT